MGSAVEKIAVARGHEIAAITDQTQPIHKSSMLACDLCIDFSTADAVLPHVKLAAENQKSIVVGTTGWERSSEEVFRIVEQHQIGLLHAPNFSIGVWLFTKLISEASRLFSQIEGYDIAGSEIHHKGKADSPSGTAKALACAILKEWKSKRSALYEVSDGQIAPDQLHFSSLRVGHIPGTHTITIDSPQDTVTLTHTAKGREGFALGAVLAAEWLNGRKGCFTMEDMFK